MQYSITKDACCIKEIRLHIIMIESAFTKRNIIFEKQFVVEADKMIHLDQCQI